MKHLFIPYELSLLAKEKEFDEPCLAYYDCYNGGSHFFLNEKAVSQDYVDYITGGTDTAVLAPLYQQIIDWFREKHSIDIDLWTLRKTWSFTLSDISEKGWTKKDKENKNVDRLYPRALSDDCKDFDLYYEALNKAIEEAFKLI